MFQNPEKEKNLPIQQPTPDYCSAQEIHHNYTQGLPTQRLPVGRVVEVDTMQSMCPGQERPT
jgi:hypothetical protein